MEEKSIKILNIEDEDVDHLALMRMVREKGLPYEVSRAENLARAAAMIEQNRYDVVLIDYKLPDGTGLDILDKLQETASIFCDRQRRREGGGKRHEGRGQGLSHQRP